MLEPASADSFGEARRSDDEDSPSRREPARDSEIAKPAEAAVQPPHRVGAAIEILLCTGFLTQILLGGLLAIFGMQSHTEAGQLSPTFVFTVSLLDTILVVAIVLFFLNAHGESPREILLGHRSIVREAFAGLLLVPVIFLLVAVLLTAVLELAPQLHNVPRNPLEDMMQTRGDALVFAIVVTLAGGLREEIQRGFILRRFEQYLGGGILGVVIYSSLFGLGHVDQGLDVALATALLGATWGGVYLTRRSIVAPMVSHAVFNLAQLLKYVTLG